MKIKVWKYNNRETVEGMKRQRKGVQEKESIEGR